MRSPSIPTPRYTSSPSSVSIESHFIAVRCSMSALAIDDISTRRAALRPVRVLHIVGVLGIFDEHLASSLSLFFINIEFEELI